MGVGAGFGEELEGGAGGEAWVVWVEVFGAGPGFEFAGEEWVEGG